MIVFGIFPLLCAALNPRLHVLGGIGVLCIVIGLILFEVLGDDRIRRRRSAPLLLNAGTARRRSV